MLEVVATENGATRTQVILAANVLKQTFIEILYRNDLGLGIVYHFVHGLVLLLLL